MTCHYEWIVIHVFQQSDSGQHSRHSSFHSQRLSHCCLKILGPNHFHSKVYKNEQPKLRKNHVFYRLADRQIVVGHEK